MKDQLAFFNADTPTVKMEWLDYRQLPVAAGGFSGLFFDYLYEFDQVASYFPSNFRETEAYETVMKSIAQREPDRQTLVRVLRSQNMFFGSPPKTLDNVALLEKPTTFAVVTGQQVGLFGGPLYTVYKTIATIKLTERLKAKFPQNDFVPVFWLEGEDHDFAEMNNTAVLDQDNKPVRIEYLHGVEMPERNLGAIGELALDGPSLELTFAKLEATLNKTDFNVPLIEKLKECYAAGRTFNQAFTAWMNYLFGECGLVFISANNPELKRLVSPIFVKELATFPQTSQLVIDRSAELEQRYHAQVKPKSVNLFMFHKEGRYLIQPRDTDFSLKGTRHFISKEDMLKIAAETPEQLSPNVVLRPLCQDKLLPSVAYVAGPSEIAYHAQLTPLYEYFGVVQPVVYPRASATLLEDRAVRAMDKYGLELIEFFEDVNRITTKVSEQISAVKLDEVFAAANRNINDALNEMKFGLNEVDPTLLGTLENLRQKTDGNMSVLKEKAIAAQKRRNETSVRQVERVAGGLLPNGALQEREINISYYLNKYGPELVKWLLRELNVTGFKHQMLSV